MREDLWLLPVGVEEILPPAAQIMEGLRRDLLDLYRSWGYELVVPPFIEYLDSLLTGTGHDLELKTFKLTDQHSGRMLGVRADMTPQVARMDAHHFKGKAPTRLCYMGTVLHTRSDGLGGTRSPLQIGAEIYGHAGAESDVEVLRMAVATLALAGIEDAYLDLGHVGIYRGLARQAGLDKRQELELFEILQRKAVSEVDDRIREYRVSEAPAAMLRALAHLNGDDALERAQVELAQAAPSVHAALAYLKGVATDLRTWLPNLPIHFDLAELRGYHYKTGVVFAAFIPGWGLEILRGGRYDDIGRVFGHARPAVGFSANLKELVRLGHGLDSRYADKPTILAPRSTDPKLRRKVNELRAEGRRVIEDLADGPGDRQPAPDCTEALFDNGDDWVVRPIGAA